jgi:hypothetical protein
MLNNMTLTLPKGCALYPAFYQGFTPSLLDRPAEQTWPWLPPALPNLSKKGSVSLLTSGSTSNDSQFMHMQNSQGYRHEKKNLLSKFSCCKVNCVH